ncbi:U-box domain-containing protein 1-like [Phoenix dactylifera]|uniref:RING-type E3 ubiquitin transferase n=1 Tax=Phoenix dactylifera TaxID=42345 RepID=A0A8B7D285_PHODC|nr:U-box domain-containing protein 1-like [Phoenix dactylifera]
MDHPPPPPGPAAFSGFLPSAALIESLVHVSAEVASMEPLPFLQSRNLSSTVRRIRLILSFFEDIRDSNAPLPPSSILCLTELFSVIRRTKSLIDDFTSGSMLWSLIQTELFSQQFHSCAKEIGRALDILPLSLLDLTTDIREQVKLLHKQARRADLFVDPRELRLREELFQVMAKDTGDCGDHSKSTGRRFLDCKKVEEIMKRVGLRSVSDYQEEISKLEAEIPKQAGTGGLVAISNINNLIALVSYSNSVISRNGSELVKQEPEQQPMPNPKDLSRSSTWSASSAVSFDFPDEFRCPITLDLMRDPVIVSSGHTYDRSSIARWLNSGHHTCPKSGKKLVHMALIPNYALKSLIDQWCRENNVPSSFWDREDGNGNDSRYSQAMDHISAARAASEAVRMTAEFLVGKLATGSPDIQRQAAYEIRLLAKTGMDNRRIIAEAGAIPFLVTMLGSRDPRTQEDAITALFNLSILDSNKILIMAAGAIDAIITVLRTGVAMEARKNAAATIFSLSMVDECKVAIGARSGAIAGLVGLLREGTAPGKRDAATALYNLAVYSANKAGVVAAGAVPLLVDLLTDGNAGVTDDVLALLALLCGCDEGMKEIGDSRLVVPILVDLLRFGSPKGKENSISVLLGLCRDGGEEMGKRLLMNPRSVPSLQSLVATGSPKARRKAQALLRLLNRCCSLSHNPIA